MPSPLPSSGLCPGRMPGTKVGTGPRGHTPGDELATGTAVACVSVPASVRLYVRLSAGICLCLILARTIRQTQEAGTAEGREENSGWRGDRKRDWLSSTWARPLGEGTRKHSFAVPGIQWDKPRRRHPQPHTGGNPMWRSPGQGQRSSEPRNQHESLLFVVREWPRAGDPWRDGDSWGRKHTWEGCRGMLVPRAVQWPHARQSQPEIMPQSWRRARRASRTPSSPGRPHR